MWFIASDMKKYEQECSLEKERITFLEKCLQGGNGADSCDTLSRKMFCKVIRRDK
jgi:hypothetical protein